MRTLRRTGFVALALASGFSATPAFATLLVSFGADAPPVLDNLFGDSDPATGRIVTTASIGGVGVALTVASSNSPGTTTAGIIQVSSIYIDNQTSSASTLVLEASDTDFTLPGSSGSQMILDSDVGGTWASTTAPGASISFRSFADPTNAQPPTAVGTELVFLKATTQTETFQGSTDTTWSRSGPLYSLGIRAVVSVNAGGQVNLSGTTTASVPEPFGATALCGCALGGALSRGRRRRPR